MANLSHEAPVHTSISNCSWTEVPTPSDSAPTYVNHVELYTRRMRLIHQSGQFARNVLRLRKKLGHLETGTRAIASRTRSQSLLKATCCKRRSSRNRFALKTGCLSCQYWGTFYHYMDQQRSLNILQGQISELDGKRITGNSPILIELEHCNLLFFFSDLLNIHNPTDVFEDSLIDNSDDGYDPDRSGYDE